jgi:hypothetical protein
MKTMDYTQITCNTCSGTRHPGNSHLAPMVRYSKNPQNVITCVTWSDGKRFRPGAPQGVRILPLQDE